MKTLNYSMTARGKMKHTHDQIAAQIKALSSLKEDQLIHIYKCASSRAERLYAPLLSAIEKELRKRRKEPIDESLEDV